MEPFLPPDIHFIQRGWVNSNNIVLDGRDGPVIVDTGHIICVEETLQLLRQHGVEPETIQLIVNTHCHWDHLGANGAIRELSGALTATGSQTAVILRQNDRQAMWLDYFGAETPPVSVEISWQDGEVVSLGNYDFEVIATPGHAPDSISLYQPESRLLISADAFHDGDCGILNTAVHGPQVLDEAIDTVSRLKQYDIAVALPGHGDLITNPSASLERLDHKLARFKNNPEKMARHLLRRVAMTGLLLMQPISRDDFIADAEVRPWPHDYAHLAGFADSQTMLNHLLDTFVKRGLVIEQDDKLVSLVPR